MRKFLFSLAAAIALIISAYFALMAGPTQARGQSLIRDAEIEHTIRSWTAPLLRAAALEPEDVALHIVSDRQINAFVTRGQRIFITTGLLMRSENPGQVMGVIAHEIGHITGGHLARLEGAISDARDQALIGSIISIAIAVLSQQPEAGVAGTAKSQDVAVRNLYKFTRVQERSADQVAVDLLERTGVSAQGLLEFFEILQDQEFLHRSRQDPYVSTHPLTSDRIEFVRNQLRTSRRSGRPLDPADLTAHARMIAKLKGFMNPPARTLNEFKASDRSVKARYARAVALYRDARIDAALPVIDSLIAEAPDDPYFHELRGQMLFESGRLEDALPAYETSVRLRPDQPLLRVGLAHVQIELNRPELLGEAQANLEQAVRYDRFMPLAWRLSATAYGRTGKLGLSALSLSEYSLLTRRLVDASGQANKAMRLLPEGSPAWIRAQDIAEIADRARRKRR